jgi:type IV pilus assembly protein PilA
MKKTNKGFSLVELIIVIAIMAILAGAIAPALIKYIDKSRKSNDVSSAKTIKTAIETALGNETAYEEVVIDGTNYITFTPEDGASALSMSGSSSIAIASTKNSTGKAESLIADALGNKCPKIKYKKSNMKFFVAEIDKNGNVRVGVSKAAASTSSENFKELTPNVDDDYQ